MKVKNMSIMDNDFTKSFPCIKAISGNVFYIFMACYYIQIVIDCMC